MRDFFLVGLIGLGLLASFRYPFAGVLMWVWFTCMDPHQEVFGFAKTLPLNLYIVIVTLLAWLVSKERRFPPMSATMVAMFLFVVWMTINSFFAVDPDWSWPLWDRNWKIIFLGVFVTLTATNKYRMHSLVWVVVLSLFYYGVKGGVHTIITGGGGHVVGPDNSIIGDNNHLAVALAMALPMANYLRIHTADRRISYALIAGMVLTAVAILGTYSRGGLVTLLGLALIGWIRVRGRLIYPILAALVIVPTILFMPQAYDDRISTMSTINSTEKDASFQGRLEAWEVAWDYASDHFPLGDGFSGAELPQVFNHYLPNAETHAAHSVFFQVLGDTGFMGLALYLVILVATFLDCARAKRRARRRPELEWAYDLANMLQLSLFAFCLGGSALSLAYYDVFFIWVGLSTALRIYVSDVVRAAVAEKLRDKGKVRFRREPVAAKPPEALPARN